MIAAGRCATAALGMLLRDQPLSPGKVSLAWSAAVGRTIDRFTSVALGPDGALAVTAADPHWSRELHRARPLIASRLNRLLGDDVVKRMEISSRTALGRPTETTLPGGGRARPPAAKPRVALPPEGAGERPRRPPDKA